LYLVRSHISNPYLTHCIIMCLSCSAIYGTFSNPVLDSPFMCDILCQLSEEGKEDRQVKARLQEEGVMGHPPLSILRPPYSDSPDLIMFDNSIDLSPVGHLAISGDYIQSESENKKSYIAALRLIQLLVENHPDRSETLVSKSLFLTVKAIFGAADGNIDFLSTMLNSSNGLYVAQELSASDVCVHRLVTIIDKNISERHKEMSCVRAIYALLPPNNLELIALEDKASILKLDLLKKMLSVTKVMGDLPDVVQRLIQSEEDQKTRSRIPVIVSSLLSCIVRYKTDKDCLKIAQTAATCIKTIVMQKQLDGSLLWDPGLLWPILNRALNGDKTHK
ncbi:hypothetical protein ADUPG1_007252, partial [Aduncisulcus paluster]